MIYYYLRFNPNQKAPKILVRITESFSLNYKKKLTKTRISALLLKQLTCK